LSAARRSKDSRNIRIAHTVLMNLRLATTTNLGTEFTGHCGDVAIAGRLK